MGLSVAIAGGIVLVAVFSVLLVVSSSLDKQNVLNQSRLDVYQSESSFRKSNFTITDQVAESGLSGFSFTLKNVGSEKLWKYNQTNMFVTYDGFVDGIPTKVNETLSYYPSAGGESNCDGGGGDTLPAGTWSINQIINDGLDPSILNPGERAEIVTNLNYDLINQTSDISVVFVSDLGKVVNSTFSTTDLNCNWADPSWLYRKLIRINHAKVAGDLTDFPVLINIVDYDLKTHAQSDGDDIFFTSSDKVTKIPHEIESYDNSDGELIAWVKVPSVSATIDTNIYMYFGNSFATDQQNGTAVWDSNYVMVQHLNGTTATRYDSTSNHNNGAVHGTVDKNDGLIDGNDDFSTTDTGINIASSASLNSLTTMTAEAWIEADSVAADETILSFYTNDNDRTYIWLDDLTVGIRAFNNINNLNRFEATTNFVPAVAKWYHLVWTIDGTYWKIYINGVQRGSTSQTITMSSLDDGFVASIGDRTNQHDREWNGIIDEVKISKIARSQQWITTEYNNQYSPLSFYTVDPFEEFGTWYDGQWNYRKKITIDHTKIAEYQVKFPVLINFTDSNLKTYAQADGGDIVFTSSDGRNKLKHEIEKYDSSNGALVAWVKVPKLYADIDTVLYMYYGHPIIANQESPTAVWDNKYEAIYHIHNDFEDSTSNNRDATNSGTVNTSALMGNGQDFERSDNTDRLQLGTWSINKKQITLETWVKFESFSQDSRLISKAKSPTSTDNHVFALAIDTTGSPSFYLKTANSDSASTTVITDTIDLVTDKWQFIAGTYDGSFLRLYINGTLVESGADTGNIRDNNWNIYAGNNPTALDRALDGVMDEIKISSTGRSPIWLLTEYRNQAFPSTFYSVGSAQQIGS